MEHLVVVGSGASAVQFALRVLRKGYRVTMLDAGAPKPAPVAPGVGFTQLKRRLPDPVQYFLGHDYGSVLYPGSKGEYYGFPPSKQFIFEKPDSYDVCATGFSPLFSFAQGGLAEAWTGGSYPLNDHELRDFMMSYADLEPYYAQVADEIGITGEDDDLTRFYPAHRHLMPPLRLDAHSRQLADRYASKRSKLNDALGVFVGRSRVATLSQDKGDRKACTYSGRCLWGCPSQSLYTPSITLHECRRHPNFDYRPRMLVTHFEYDANATGNVTTVVARSLDDGAVHAFRADRYILAAGTLSTSKIFLESIRRKTGEIPRLDGLMDNRQVLLPYVNLRMIGKRFEDESYQYHQLALGIAADHPDEYVHCQITALKTAMVHPIVQSMPFDLKTSTFVFRNARAALGIVNINLHDRRRRDNYVTLAPGASAAEPVKLVISYSPPADEAPRLRRAISTVKKALWKLGCVAPPGMTHVRPMGASVHYAGTIPMSSTPRPFTATPNCRSNDFGNLYFVDGTTFPFLPAKNLTFTLMANASRVADQEF